MAALLILLAASAGFSRLLRTRRVHRYLNARLEAAFGRPVEIGQFGFSLLDGLRLEADSVTVAEDPRFGHEYFLRAERLTASLRWLSLARGRFEFGTLSFMRPSLNLVRANDGHWNVESWLPPPGPAPPRPAGASLGSRLYRIEVDTGRINFKRSADKDALALVDVKGHLEQESAGRWRMDLQARPTRATVALQEAGTLRLRGRIAGTSARLQPAELALSWQEVSLADALRLARGRDYGLRGRLAAEVTARIAAPGLRWSLAGAARLVRVHRWDLPPRPGDPALNLTVEAQWRPGDARVEFSKCVLEAPGSSVGGTAMIEWAPAFDPKFRFTSSGISLADLLAWYRAFRPGVAEDLALEGHAAAELVLGGWPPRLEQGVLASDGARLRVAGLREPVQFGGLSARVTRGRLEVAPVAIALPAAVPAAGETPTPQPRPAQARPGNWLRVGGAIEPARGSPGALPGEWDFEISLVGQSDRAEDLLAVAAALGHPLNHGWTAEGPAGLRISWQGAVRPFTAQPQGSIELRGLRLRALYLNQPILLGNARIELRAGQQRLTLSAAQGFGAQWKGWLAKNSLDAGAGWDFELSADRLDAAELDRWLGPRARPGLLERIVPFAAPRGDSSERDAALARLRGRGRISAEEVFIAPLSLRRLRARAEIEGRKITLRSAQADFYGGTAKGSLQAELSAQPTYRLETQFERVNLGLLVESTATLKRRFAGMASGELRLAARGIGRENLQVSLEGRGALQVRRAELRGLDLRATYFAGHAVSGTTQFALADGGFALAARSVRIEGLRFSNREDDFEAAGSVDFSRALDLRLGLVGRPRDTRPQEAASKTVRITGPLDAPQVTRLEPQSKKQ